jgi:hypothetical protein
MKNNQAQGRKLISLLKRRNMTTIDLLQTGISTCSWKRVVEQLNPNEQLLKTKRYPEKGRWFYVYRVVTVKG